MAVTFAKRQRERSRHERQQEKELRVQARRAEKATRVVTPGEDPDIAGIVPGPQPVLEEP